MTWLLAIPIALIGAFIWLYRIHTAGLEDDGSVNGPDDVRIAAVRLGYMGSSGIHPIECIEDERIAAAGIVLAVAERDGAVSKQEIMVATSALAGAFELEDEEAEMLATLAHWIAAQCTPASASALRLSQRLRSLSGTRLAAKVIEMAREAATAETGRINPEVAEKLEVVITYFSEPGSKGARAGHKNPLRPLSTPPLSRTTV